MRRPDRPVWIILAHSADDSALWAFGRLRARAACPVELVVVEALDTPTTSWAHEVGAQGASVEVDRGQGRRLRTGDACAVLNRMSWPPLRPLAAAAPADAAYAHSELTAFAVSWLRSLAPVVVNQPTSQGLCGRWRPPLHWRMLATRAGLPTAPLQMTSGDFPRDPNGAGPSSMTLMIGGELLTDTAPGPIRSAARRLAALSETTILGLRFAGTDPARGGWRLLDATPQPDLTAAGDAGITALEKVLAR